MVGELYKLAEKSQKQVQKPTGQGRLLQWYFFLVAAFWMYFRWPTAPSFFKIPHKHILSDLQQESHRTVSARGFLMQRISGPGWQCAWCEYELHRILEPITWCCRFIRNQLVVEITSSAQLAHFFGWALKKHTILAFSLYTAGAPL